MDSDRFVCPTISTDDIEWATELLGLPPQAFVGMNEDDPRSEIIASMEPMDVSACPGSGKTTLLVAKLAILARKWKDRTRGICVLSHTNAARKEIQSRLGNTSEGNLLLRYPHFIGTIHGFVNEFLAVPWLRSQGYPIKCIDTDICEQKRWSKVQWKYRSGLVKRRIEKASVRLADVEFGIALKSGGNFPMGEATPTYRAMVKAFEDTAQEGYHCYDDMFLWAEDLIGHMPIITAVFRDRFPLLFVDEAQDNSEIQSTILHRIFSEGNAPSIRQRLGDPNQAIYDFLLAKGATTDGFPDDAVKRDIPNSYRFDQSIADVADPLGMTPYGLVGLGPKNILDSGHADVPHTVFVFDDVNMDRVLDAYADLLLDTFSDDELSEGVFTALGQVHRPTGDDHLPRHVGHYWSDYDASISSSACRPQTFVQCVSTGQSMVATTGEACSAVNTVADGVLRFSASSSDGRALQRRRNSHRHLMQELSEQPVIRDKYMDIIADYVIAAKPLSKSAWDDGLRDAVLEIGEAIAGVPASDLDASGFLTWPDDVFEQDTSAEAKTKIANVYERKSGDRTARIQVRSIHSAKGETHTATLVLETYWYTHNLEDMRPWLDGTQSGEVSSSRQNTRLKAHYVAMTRPSHLLCLAIKKSTMDGCEGLAKRFRDRGWQIEDLSIANEDIAE